MKYEFFRLQNCLGLAECVVRLPAGRGDLQSKLIAGELAASLMNINVFEANRLISLDVKYLSLAEGPYGLLFVESEQP